MSDADKVAMVRADAERLRDGRMPMPDIRATVGALLARVDELERALRTIQAWDCLNPPQVNLLADLAWLKRTVNAALDPHD